MTTAPETAAERSAAEPPATERRERTFTWEDPVAIARAMAGMSGADFFTAVDEGKVPPPPILQALDLAAITIAEGHATCQLAPQEFHYNPLGTVHGGVLSTMLDSVCGCAVHAMLPEGVLYTSLDLAVKFLRPVTVETGPVTADGVVVHLGRRTALAEAKLTDAAGKVYAAATSSCLIMRPEGPAHRPPGR